MDGTLFLPGSSTIWAIFMDGTLFLPAPSIFKPPGWTALTENLFHDNAQDLAFLESYVGKRAIVNLHVEGIIHYLQTK